MSGTVKALFLATGLGLAAMLAKCGETSGTADRGRVERGRALFSGKGNCTVCHQLDGGSKERRGPDLAGIGARAAKRAAQFELTGEFAGTRYLTNGIVRPAAEVVEGYNPMPQSWLPSGLSDDDIFSLVLYLQSLGGTPDPAAISLPEARLAALREDYAREREIFSFGVPTRGQKIFHDLKGNSGCIRCHSIDGEGQHICPDLTTVHLVQRPRYMLESILDSSAFLVHGYRQVTIWDDVGVIHVGLPVKEDEKTLTLVIDDKGTTEVIEKDRIDERRLSDVSRMPGNFAELLTARDVMDLVAYLLHHEQLAAEAKAAAETAEQAAAGAKPGTSTPPPSLDVFGEVTADQKRYRMAMERGDAKVGGRIYGHYCVMCHGVDGTGTGFNAVNLETKPANHTDDRRMAKTEDRLLHGVITRGGMQTGRSFLMPPWGGTLGEQEVWDLVAYLRTLHADVK